LEERRIEHLRNRAYRRTGSIRIRHRNADRPVPISGASTLICVALTYDTYPGNAPKFTITPSNFCGNTPPMIEFDQESATDARLVPLIVTQEFGPIPGWKLAPFTTEVITGRFDVVPVAFPSQLPQSIPA
jgi:hypothetical protein